MSSGIYFEQKGNFSKTDKFLKEMQEARYLDGLDKYGIEGVRALASMTPVDTGRTASSWSYEIVKEGDHTSIFFNNSNIRNGVNIAVILQFGHGTRNGGYVYGRDYINPAIRPVFDHIAEAAWREVTSA